MSIRQEIRAALDFHEAKNLEQLMSETGYSEKQVRNAINMLRDEGVFVAQDGGMNGGWYLRNKPAPSAKRGRKRWKAGPPPPRPDMPVQPFWQKIFQKLKRSARP